MGMYDTVNFSCPICRTHLEVQSKSGKCLLNDYSCDEVPPEIATDIVGDDVYCDKCEKSFKVAKRDKNAVPLKLIKTDDEDF